MNPTTTTLRLKNGQQVQVRLNLFGQVDVAELAERLDLDLTDAAELLGVDSSAIRYGFASVDLAQLTPNRQPPQPLS